MMHSKLRLDNILFFSQLSTIGLCIIYALNYFFKELLSIASDSHFNGLLDILFDTQGVISKTSQKSKATEASKPYISHYFRTTRVRMCVIIAL